MFIEARGPTFLWVFFQKKITVKYMYKEHLYYRSWLSGSVEGGGPTPLHVASPVATASLSAVLCHQGLALEGETGDTLILMINKVVTLIP